VYVVALEVEVRIPGARSLKDKRQAIKPLLEVSRRRFSISAAEVAAQDAWQRAVLGFAVVASTASGAERVIGDVEDFLWSSPDVEVGSVERRWLE
jgi:uncharacterized protein YlxP (DUF503 family)